MGNIETLKKPEKTRKSSETTLEALKIEEAELATRLEKNFPDDEEYFAALTEAQKYLAEANSTYLTGVERARLMVLVEKFLGKTETTERGSASSAFKEVSRQREKAQEEIWKIQKGD